MDWLRLLTVDEQKVLQALADPRWDARTMNGLVKDTALSPVEIERVIERHRNLIEVIDTPEHGPVFFLRNRVAPLGGGIWERTLDYLSLGRRKRIA